MKPPHAAGHDRLPVKIAWLQERARFVRAIVEDDRRSHAVPLIAIDGGHVWTANAIMLEMFVEGLDSHSADALGDQFADRIVHDG